MNFLIFIALCIVSSNAQSDTVCCFARLASGDYSTTCTPAIPRVLCERGGGRVEIASTETCCCYGQNAAPSDKCLSGVLKSTCLGTSVRGTCGPPVVARCCCTPAGASAANCIPRIPTDLCSKAIGASCVVGTAPTSLAPTAPGATTTSASCTCRIMRASGDLTLQLTRAVCAKYSGVCVTTAPTPVPTVNEQCCCIYDGATYPDGTPVTATDVTDPSTLSPPLCIAETPISLCLGTSRKRVGACWTGSAAPTASPTSLAPTVAPRCFCKDPTSDTGQPIQDNAGNDAYMLQHVCVEKLGSQCVEEKCCCKFPSATGEPCLPNINKARCFAVNGAVCELMCNNGTAPAIDCSAAGGDVCVSYLLNGVPTDDCWTQTAFNAFSAGLSPSTGISGFQGCTSSLCNFPITQQPSVNPTQQPSVTPTQQPSVNPTQQPSVTPTQQPSVTPTVTPSICNGVAGPYSYNPGDSNQTRALLACESHFGAGTCCIIAHGYNSQQYGQCGLKEPGGAGSFHWHWDNHPAGHCNTSPSNYVIGDVVSPGWCGSVVGNFLLC